MLVRFIISNYLSFKDETEFNMLTGSVRRKKEHVYQFGDVELLKTAGIYGANGAGKSNLIRAMILMQAVVVEESGVDNFRFEAFRLNAQMKDIPTQMEIEFITENEMYDYGVAVFEGKIVEEWLYKTKKKNDELVFERTLKDGQMKIKVHESLQKTPEDALRFKLYEEELLPDNQTLLGMLAKAKKVLPDIKNVFDWFENKLTIIDQESKIYMLPLQYYYMPAFKDFADNLMKTLNTGVKGLKLKTLDINTYFGIDDVKQASEIKKRLRVDNSKFEVIHEPDSNHVAFAVLENDKVVIKRLVTLHEDESQKGIEFEVEDESDGTQRLFDFTPAFFDIIYDNKTYIIDEIDQSLHPHLLKKLISKFVNDKTSKGQLIFTTHDSNLLDQNIFRQDEIWFVEKKKSGETTLYPLSEFKIRYDLDIEKGYLNGRFGAIPFLGNLDDLNWNAYAS